MMNGWVVGLCVVIWYLACQAFRSAVKFRATIKMFKEITEIIVEIAEMPEKEIGELKGTMAAVENSVKSDVVFRAVAWAGMTIFLIVLACRGHL